eukprot:14896777-Ditylum_brightwellii.AAC.1
MGLGGLQESWNDMENELPDWMFGIFTINFLKFLANIITHWITVPFIPPLLHYLNLSGSTNTVGWHYKFSFNLNTHFEYTVLARKYAEVGMSHNLVGYNQYVQGIHNWARWEKFV